MWLHIIMVCRRECSCTPCQERASAALVPMSGSINNVAPQYHGVLLHTMPGGSYTLSMLMLFASVEPMLTRESSYTACMLMWCASVAPMLTCA